jgi:hypothetical protein
MKPFSDRVLFLLALALSAAAIALGGFLYLASGKLACLLPLPLLLAAWLAYRLAADTPTADGPAARRKIGEAILIAALLLCAALASRLSGVAADMFGQRGLGVLMGAVVIVFANVIPKQSSSRLGMAIRRMAGWSLVLGGLGYALAWLLLPLAVAGNAALAMLLAATVFALVRGAWLMKQRTAPPSRTG